jgi:hypothetical protein
VFTSREDLPLCGIHGRTTITVDTTPTPRLSEDTFVREPYNWTIGPVTLRVRAYYTEKINNPYEIVDYFNATTAFFTNDLGIPITFYVVCLEQVPLDTWDGNLPPDTYNSDISAVFGSSHADIANYARDRFVSIGARWANTWEVYPKLLAHELGHVFGLDDAYTSAYNVNLSIPMWYWHNLMSRTGDYLTPWQKIAIERYLSTGSAGVDAANWGFYVSPDTIIEATMPHPGDYYVCYVSGLCGEGTASDNMYSYTMLQCWGPGVPMPDVFLYREVTTDLYNRIIFNHRDAGSQLFVHPNAIVSKDTGRVYLFGFVREQAARTLNAVPRWIRISFPEDTNGIWAEVDETG